MTQLPEEGAVGGEPIAPELTPEERLDAAFGEQQEGEIPQEEGAEPTAEADDDIELEAETDDLPPIDAPISWTAEEKERFAGLPRETQEFIAKRETEREKFVQTKAQEASRARQEIEQAAYQQLAQYDRHVSEQLQQYAEALAPQRPNPALLQHDPHAFYQLQAEYEGKVAQQRDLQQQAQEYAQQAQQREALVTQQEMQREAQLIAETFPEYLDPTNGPKLQQELSAVARELGYPPELIQQARAPDILAMRTAAQWKAKADKLDRLEAKKMEKVRAAKALPKVSTPGTQKAPGAAQQSQYAADRELARRGDRDAAARVIDSFFDNPR